MGRSFRRRFAPLIRIRQEVDKRLDPVLRWGAGAPALDRLLQGEVAQLSCAAARDDDELRRTLAARSATRFPLAHLRRRDAAQLPAREELDHSIRDAASGAWSVFGAAVHVDARVHDWTRHPVTGAVAGRGHWTHVRYMDGVGGGDVKAIWELSRHQQLVRLAQGYFLDHNEALAATLLALVDRWIDQNPQGRGINWTSSLEVAFRGVAWCWVWALTCHSTAWTPARTRKFLASLWHHARHVERFDSVHHSPNTHLTGEGLGLLYIGLCFPELSRAGQWVRRGREILESELDAQLFDDGMHFERSVGYHRYTVEFYLHYLLLADAFGFSVAPGVRQRVRAQLDVTRALRRPDGTWPIIGDEDSGDTLLLTATDAHDQGPLLAVGGGVFSDASSIRLTTAAHRAAGWWLLGDTQWDFLRAASLPEVGGGENVTVHRATALPTAGYFIGRDDEGPDGWWCLVDAGPHGGDRTGHAHTDLGHVEIAHGSTHIVVDPGCAGYTTDLVARDRSRSEAAHGCLVIADSPLAEPAGPFSWTRIAPTPAQRHGDSPDVWWCELSYSRPHASGSLMHQRQVVLVRGRGVVIWDRVLGVGDPRLAVHWPLADNPPSLALSDGVLAGAGYSVTWSSSPGVVRPSLDRTRRSPGYGRECAATTLRLACPGPLPTSLVTCFAETNQPFQVQAHAVGSIQLLITSERAGGDRVLVIRHGTPPAMEPSSVRAASHGVVG